MKPPISDPFEAPYSNVETRVFYFDLWRIIQSTLLFTLLITLLVWATLASTRGYVKFVFTFATLCVMVAASIIPWAFIQVEVTETELKAPNFWGFSQKIEWTQIEEARYRWLVWPYVLISSPTKRNFIWLPLYLSNMKGFARAVEEWAPADNPLRLFLQKREF